jgi:cation diffusion facilitator CzcD-associated flavoprotein CzcO
MPLLEDLGYMLTKKYAYGAEIRTYLQALARHFESYSKVLFQTQATELHWEENSTSWKISNRT